MRLGGRRCPHRRCRGWGRGANSHSPNRAGASQVRPGGTDIKSFTVSVVITPPAVHASIGDAITRAVATVFGTMLHRPVRLAETTLAPLAPAATDTQQVIGSVGFVGRINGIVYLSFPEAFSQLATAQILGMSEGEVEMSGPDLVKDVIGELTNMTVGGFKNTLSDLGYPCRLTLPVIVRGHHVAVAAIKSAHREIYHFDSVGHRISADIQMMPE